MSNRKQTNKELPAGWSPPPDNGRKFHYFRAGESTSVCGKIGFNFSSCRENNNHKSKDNCSACMRKM